MKLYKILVSLFLVSFGFMGCYTIFSHPTVRKDDYTNRIKFYDDCFSCHSKAELVDYGYEYLHRYPATTQLNPIPIYTEPIYSPPWWIGLVIPSEVQSDIRSNDETRLRNQDGGRTSAPATFDLPSRNTGNSNNTNSSNSSSKNSVDSSKERDSRESNNTKTRDNSGERKK